MRRILPLCFCLALLAGCFGPQYRTEYQYFPPQEASGQGCTSTCLVNQTNCQLACTTQQAQCRQRAQLRDALDNVSYRGGYWQNGYSLSAFRPSGFGGQYADSLCRADACLDICRAGYHRCYTACGGDITERTRCIAHCPNHDQGTVQ